MSLFKRKKQWNKKGDVGDIFFMAVGLIIFSIALLLGYKIADGFNTEIQNSDLPEAYGRNASINLNNQFKGVLDNSFLFLAIALGIGAIMMAAMVRIHPIFLALYFLLLAFIIILSGLFSNVYQEMATQPELATLANDLTFTTHIMTWLPLIVGVFGSLLAIVMYKSWQEARL